LCRDEGVDGRDKPGHDDAYASRAIERLVPSPRMKRWRINPAMTTLSQ
jgi:hypothetical protein